MRASLRAKAIAVCDAKIAQKGDRVGLSCYAFFAHRNDDAALLMEAATWWIQIHKLDHFEKAVRIRALVASGGQVNAAIRVWAPYRAGRCLRPGRISDRC